MLHDGIIYHNSGADQDELFFAYPLTGEFEFSFDVYQRVRRAFYPAARRPGE